MIKSITERSLHEVLQKMRARGVTLKDTEGFGINVDQSGHIYVVYMGEEEETGIIDTSAGEAGVSAWINPGATNPTGYIEIGQVSASVAYGSETLSMSGTTGTVTLAQASNDNYVLPRTFFVEATDNAPELVDDGLGNVVVNNLDRRKLGTIDYDTGAVSVTYIGNAAPNSNPRVKYEYSPLPNSSVFPKVVALSHIVFVVDSSHKVDFELYNNNPANTNSDVHDAPVFFQYSGSTANRIGSTGNFMVEEFCDGRISICLNTDVSDRKIRWMKISSSAVVKAIYVYWNRLST